MKLDEKYNISGMTCSACSSRVDKVVRNLNGVKEVNVNLLTNTMVVSYDDTITNSEDIINAVKKSGYGATLIIENKNHQLKKEDLASVQYNIQHIKDIIKEYHLLKFTFAGAKIFFDSEND